MSLKSHRIFRVGLFSLLLVGTRTETMGADLVVDQSNIAFAPSLFQNIQAYSPIGQSFTPTLTSLNFVSLSFEDFEDPTVEVGATVQLNIRSGSIFGSILGTSLPTSVTAVWFGRNIPTRGDFYFPFGVPLTPGSLYVIDVFETFGDQFGLGSWGNGPLGDTYPNGYQILGGQPQTGRNNNDLWFEEGTGTPEPSTMLLFASGAIALAGFKNRRKP